MALTDLTASITLGGTLRAKKALDLSTTVDTITFGSGNFDAVELSLSFGTADSQANQIFHDERTILTGANDDLDLAGGLTNPFGETITFTVLKWLLVCIDSPDGTKSLRVGPQNVANAWQGPWGGTGATVYSTVHSWSVLANDPYTGYTVTGGSADVLRINNPGAGTVSYRIVIVGES